MQTNKLKPIDFKKIKVNNIIAVGGMIAAGKTTLVDDLSNALSAKTLYELDDNDELQKVLLKGLYEKKKIVASVFQLYFLLNRYENYHNISNCNEYVIVDRTIFEDRLFAHQNMAEDPIVFSFYDEMWKQKAYELIYNDGVPKLYIILAIDFETFKQRLFQRNRLVEVENFDINESYFRSLNEHYVEFLEQTCKTYGIDYLILDAKLPNEQKIELIKQELNKLDAN